MTEKHNNISLFAVSFKQGFISPNIPIASFYQGDKKLNFLLDSGADKNIIDAEALKNLQYTEVQSNDTTHLSGIGGEPQEVSICTLSFGCEDEKYTEEFLITNMRSSGFDLIEKEHCIIIHGILGSTFLRKHNIILDFKNLAAYSQQ